RQHSTNEVDAPRKPITHIQKIAPGPPKAMAVATPAILPMPMRPDIDNASAWNEDTPASDFCPEKVSRVISTRPRTCMKRVRNENHSPAPRHSAISALLQMMPFTQPRIASTYYSPPVGRRS